MKATCVVKLKLGNNYYVYTIIPENSVFCSVGVKFYLDTSKHSCQDYNCRFKSLCNV